MKRPAKNLESEDSLQIRGILVPEDWDSSNRVTKMALCTAGEQEFLIETDPRGCELLKYKGLKAVLNGQLKDTGTPRKRIVVSSYEIYEW